jgi:hypothetical protein
MDYASFNPDYMYIYIKIIIFSYLKKKNKKCLNLLLSTLGRKRNPSQKNVGRRCLPFTLLAAPSCFTFYSCRDCANSFFICRLQKENIKTDTFTRQIAHIITLKNVVEINKFENICSDQFTFFTENNCF